MTNEATVLTKDENDQAVITLRYVEQARCAWAWIGGKPQSTVWIDRRAAGGQMAGVDLQLAPRSIQEGNENTYGGAFPLTPGTELRACGQVRQEPTCTLWFDGENLTTDDLGPGPKVVALGDSFSAGEGAKNYRDGTDNGENLCHRSENAYGVQVAKLIGRESIFAACSGAKIIDYWNGQKDRYSQPPQRDLINPNADLVTVSMGGNDVGFSGVVMECVGFKLKHPTDADCLDKIELARAATINLVKNEKDPKQTLPAMLRDIHEKAPNARVMIMGYPQVFPDPQLTQCDAGGPFVPNPFGKPTRVTFLVREMKAMNGLSEAINQMVKRAAKETGSEYVNVASSLHKNGPCADEGDRWMNGLEGVWPASKRNQSYHPNQLGQAAFASRFEECWTDPSVCVP